MDGDKELCNLLLGPLHCCRQLIECLRSLLGVQIGDLRQDVIENVRNIIEYFKILELL